MPQSRPGRPAEGPSRERGSERRTGPFLREATAALDGGDRARAREVACRRLESVDPRQRGVYGNVQHFANLILGLVALSEGQLPEARHRLIASAKTPGSTHLKTLGPNMALAAELLDRGERDVVVDYLRLCRRLWKDGKRLKEWETLARNGRFPDFGYQVDHGLRDVMLPQQVDTLKKLAKLQWAMRERGRAREYAHEALRRAESVRRHWNYGNVVHEAHLVLGHVALAEGKLDEAGHQLLMAGRTPGSPQLRHVGPHMSLAKRLLERGRRFAILEYLRLCGRFWKDSGRLAAWEKTVRGGGIPEFGHLLMEGRL